MQNSWNAHWQCDSFKAFLCRFIRNARLCAVNNFFLKVQLKLFLALWWQKHIQTAELTETTGWIERYSAATTALANIPTFFLTRWTTKWSCCRTAGANSSSLTMFSGRWCMPRRAPSYWSPASRWVVWNHAFSHCSPWGTLQFCSISLTVLLIPSLHWGHCFINNRFCSWININVTRIFTFVKAHKAHCSTCCDIERVGKIDKLIFLLFCFTGMF